MKPTKEVGRVAPDTDQRMAVRRLDLGEAAVHEAQRHPARRAAGRLREEVQPMATEIRVFAPATAEMRFWRRVLRGVLQPPLGPSGILGRALRFALVTPTAHLAWLSEPFQMYLYVVFHQTRLARMGHRIGFPIVIAALCATLAPLHLGPAPASLQDALISPNLALLGVGALSVYHGHVARSFRSARFGVVIVTLGLLLYGLGVGGAWALGNLGPTPPAPWLPLQVALGAALAVALSHAGEPALPPRANGTERWIQLSEFMRSAPGPAATAARLLRVLGALIAGAFDELWGAPRLYALVVLRDLGPLAPATPERQQIDRWARDAIASGDAALDFIGIGGGASAPAD